MRTQSAINGQVATNLFCQDVGPMSCCLYRVFQTSKSDFLSFTDNDTTTAKLNNVLNTFEKLSLMSDEKMEQYQLQANVHFIYFSNKIEGCGVTSLHQNLELVSSNIFTQDRAELEVFNQWILIHNTLARNSRNELHVTDLLNWHEQLFEGIHDEVEAGSFRTVGTFTKLGNGNVHHYPNHKVIHGAMETLYCLIASYLKQISEYSNGFKCCQMPYDASDIYRCFAQHFLLDQDLHVKLLNAARCFIMKNQVVITSDQIERRIRCI
jgi:hypothetical protein